jgi:hypothetical protein
MDLITYLSDLIIDLYMNKNEVLSPIVFLGLLTLICLAFNVGLFILDSKEEA